MAQGIGGLFSRSCSRARRGTFFQCNFFRFDFGSIFGSIKASIEKGIEKGFEEESKLENRNRPKTTQDGPKIAQDRPKSPQCNSSASVAGRLSDRSRLQSKKVAKKVSKRIRNWKSQVCWAVIGATGQGVNKN